MDSRIFMLLYLKWIFLASLDSSAYHVPQHIVDLDSLHFSYTFVSLNNFCFFYPKSYAVRHLLNSLARLRVALYIPLACTLPCRFQLFQVIFYYVPLKIQPSQSNFMYKWPSLLLFSVASSLYIRRTSPTSTA